MTLKGFELALKSLKIFSELVFQQSVAFTRLSARIKTFIFSKLQSNGFFEDLEKFLDRPRKVFNETLHILKFGKHAFLNGSSMKPYMF